MQPPTEPAALRRLSTLRNGRTSRGDSASRANGSLMVPTEPAALRRLSTLRQGRTSGGDSASRAQGSLLVPTGPAALRSQFPIVRVTDFPLTVREPGVATRYIQHVNSMRTRAARLGGRGTKKIPSLVSEARPITSNLTVSTKTIPSSNHFQNKLVKPTQPGEEDNGEEGELSPSAEVPKSEQPAKNDKTEVTKSIAPAQEDSTKQKNALIHSNQDNSTPVAIKQAGVRDIAQQQQTVQLKKSQHETRQAATELNIRSEEWHLYQQQQFNASMYDDPISISFPTSSSSSPNGTPCLSPGSGAGELTSLQVEDFERRWLALSTLAKLANLDSDGAYQRRIPGSTNPHLHRSLEPQVGQLISDEECALHNEAIHNFLLLVRYCGSDDDDGDETVDTIVLRAWALRRRIAEEEGGDRRGVGEEEEDGSERGAGEEGGDKRGAGQEGGGSGKAIGEDGQVRAFVKVMKGIKEGDVREILRWYRIWRDM